MSDAKVQTAKQDYDRANLELARAVMANPTHSEMAHLVEWARRVVERLGK